MGCGSWGGNAVDENVHWKHYMQSTRIVREIPANEPSLDEIFADYWKALLTDAGIGTPPDAYLMNNFNWQEYINAGMGIDLAPAAAVLDTPGTNVDEYIPSLLEAAKREGKLYGFPKATNGSGKARTSAALCGLCFATRRRVSAIRSSIQCPIRRRTAS